MEGERRWASGRILTQAQRERKRERNRLSRKRAVDRARDRTAVLEESLRSMRACAEIDISAQQSFFNQDIQCPALVPSGQSRTESLHTVPIDNPGGLLVPTLEESQTISTTSSCPQTTPCFAAVPAIPTQIPTDCSVGGNHSWPTVHGVSPQTEPEEFFNNLLCSALHGEVGAICKDDQVNEDLLGRVILGGGWNAVFDQARPVSCPLLAVLRYLDEAALQDCRPIDRLALLRAVHTRYLSIIFGRTSARQELPPWYRSRPTQLLLNHSLIIDFAIWPGMRERLTLLGDLTALPGLWRSYINHFRFCWPGRLEDAFETNHSGDRYKLSGEFYNRFNDLYHWRMDTGFFNDFPAFVDDIPPAPTIPQHVAL